MFCEIFKSISPIAVNYMLGDPLLNPTDKHPSRVVTHYELEYVSWGYGGVLIDGVETPAKSHYLNFRRPGMVVQGFGQYESKWIEFCLDEYGTIIEELEQMPINYALQDYSFVENIFDLIYGDFYTDSLTKILRYKIHVLQLFEVMLNNWYHVSQPTNCSEEIRLEIKSSLNYIQKNFANTLHVPDLAQIAGYSVYHYTRVFKQITGWTPVEYINKCRVNYAKKNLVETNESIEDILYSCGFNNYSYFFRIFKEQVKCTPNEYRRRHRLDTSNTNYLRNKK